jgi:IS30 family transposase
MTSTEPGVGHLPGQFSDDDRMQISHEATRRRCSRRAAAGCAGGSTARLRTGRALHRPRRRVDTRATRRIADMVPIGGRLAEAEAEAEGEAEDRAVPGYWDGDLIVGAHGTSSSSTLVERSTRSVMSPYLPDDHRAETVHAAIVGTLTPLPAVLRRSST